MPRRAAANAPQDAFELPQFKQETIQVFVVGQSDSPFLCNAMSEKAKRQLLMPAQAKGRSQRQASLKHNPLAEFRDSPYMLSAATAPTLLAIKATAFKGAMSGVTRDVGGVAKTEIGRRVHVMGDYVPMRGIPTLRMDVVRMADINRTPDVRTRAAVLRWATVLNIRYIDPLIRVKMIVDLLAASGFTQGVGDGRPEKGKMACGMFRVCNQSDPEWQEIVATGGRAAQVAAMQHPAFYDEEARDLFSWFADEAKQRGFDIEDKHWELGVEELFSADLGAALLPNAKPDAQF